MTRLPPVSDFSSEIVFLGAIGDSLAGRDCVLLVAYPPRRLTSSNTPLVRFSLRQVGYKSVDDYVTSGMVVGLGTGSTAAFAGRRCCRRFRNRCCCYVAVPQT